MNEKEGLAHLVEEVRIMREDMVRLMKILVEIEEEREDRRANSFIGDFFD